MSSEMEMIIQIAALNISYPAKWCFTSKRASKVDLETY
jgi:hypothetical protein